MINSRLVKRYKVRSETNIFVSGDLAEYIQSAPDKIRVCRAIYAPDEYHIKHAIKCSFDFKISDEELNDPIYQKMLVDSLYEIDTIDTSKIRTLIMNNPRCYLAYLNPNYEGCSQECTKSHYYCPRFAKVPNVFKHMTVQKNARMIDARENGSRVNINFKEEFYETPLNIELGKERMDMMRYDIDTSQMSFASKRMFRNTVYGES